jgi:hypothetical protein
MLLISLSGWSRTDVVVAVWTREVVVLSGDAERALVCGLDTPV